MKARSAEQRRKTRETDIRVKWTLDGTGKARVRTGMPFMDHMLELLARHSVSDLVVEARGDLEVDFHHTVEDLGLVLGSVLSEALGDRHGITRVGSSDVPMDESLSRVVVDLGGRPYLVLQMANTRRRIRTFDTGLVRECLQAFTVQGRLNLHVHQCYGDEPHHAYESVFKALARALRMAWTLDPQLRGGVPSSKGTI